MNVITYLCPKPNYAMGVDGTPVAINFHQTVFQKVFYVLIEQLLVLVVSVESPTFSISLISSSNIVLIGKHTNRKQRKLPHNDARLKVKQFCRTSMETNSK